MKHYLIILFSLFIGFNGHAQLKPEEGDFGLGFKITGLANIGLFNKTQTILNDVEWDDPVGILPVDHVTGMLPQQMIFGKYYVTPKMALRLGLGVAMVSNKMITNDSTSAGSFTITESLSAFSIGLNIGLEKHFASNALRIDPYAGFEISGGYLGSLEYMHEEAYNAPTNTHTLRTVSYPGGWAIGGHAFVGFNYFISSNFALGAEASLGFDHFQLGGLWTDTTEDINANQVNMYQSGDYRQRLNAIRVNSTGGINATIYF